MNVRVDNANGTTKLYFGVIAFTVNKYDQFAWFTVMLFSEKVEYYHNESVKRIVID